MPEKPLDRGGSNRRPDSPSGCWPDPDSTLTERLRATIFLPEVGEARALLGTDSKRRYAERHKSGGTRGGLSGWMDPGLRTEEWKLRWCGGRRPARRRPGRGSTEGWSSTLRVERRARQGTGTTSVATRISTLRSPTRGERYQRYTVFAGSASAINRVASDRLGPGQQLAVEAIEACDRLTSRGNPAPIRCAPTHPGIEGNEMADLYAKCAAENAGDATDSSYLQETSLAHMTRMTTEARASNTSIGSPATSDDTVTTDVREARSSGGSTHSLT